MTCLLLLRHAESEWNAVGRWQGVADPPLSTRGEEQANQAGRLLRGEGIGVVVSSDLRRARDTARRIAAGLAVPGPIAVDAGLREYDLGAWSGLTRAEIEAEWPGQIDQWRHGQLFATPGGERRDHFVTRLVDAVTRVAAQHPGQTVLAVSHGGVLSALARALGQPPVRFTHLAGFWVDAGPGGLHVGDEVSLLGLARPMSDQGGEAESTTSGVTDRQMDTPAR